MKYIISAIVTGENLSEALNGLHKFAPTVNVSHIQSADIGTTAAQSNGTSHVAKAPASAPVKTVKVKKHTRAKRDVRDGSLNEAAKAIIDSYGTPAFELKDLMAKAEAKGLTAPTVFRSIRLEIDAGRLLKVRPGVYQRKGASFAQQLGFTG